MPNSIVFDEQARDAMRSGVSQLARAAKVTFGPRGRNVIYETSNGSVAVTRDGVTVVSEMELDDPLEDVGAKLVREVASKTSDRVGDGTTTATVLAEAIFTEGLKAVVAGVNPVSLQRGIERAVADVTASLAEMATPVKTRKKMEQVATVACNHDARIGSLLAEVIQRLGQDGIVAVDEGRTTETEIEWTDGFRFDQGFLSPYFVTDAVAMESQLEDAWILITDRKITSTEVA